VPIARQETSILISLFGCVLVTGCLTDSYAIRRDELARIAALPPENRGTHVRVTQQTSFSDSYAEPEPQLPPADGPNGVVIITGPSQIHQHHDPVHSGVGIAPAVARRQPARLSRGGGSSPGGARPGGATIGGGSSSAGKGSDAEVAATIAVAALVVGTGAFSIAAMTEGPRFDGWAGIPSEQLIMLKPRGMAPYWVPLGDLTVEDAAHAEHAEVRPNNAQLLERAPLDRVGVSTSLELGASALRSTNAGNYAGLMARYSLGGFPLQWLGLLGNAGFSAGSDNGALFEGRLGLELRVQPLRLGRVHLGGYGDLGHSWLMHDISGGTARGQGAYYGAGGLLEIDLTTRLGLLLRGGAAWLPRYDSVARSSDDQRPLVEFSIGLGVY